MGTTLGGSVHFAGLSDIGRQRSSNQDCWGADADQALFMVADGVAGSTDGALAAHLVVELLPTYVARHLKPADSDDSAQPELLGRAVAEFCDHFRAYGNTDSRVAGASTTVVAVVVAGSRALVVHLGDSRAYLCRERRLQRLTRDHSLIQDLLDAHQVDIEHADEHPARATLTRHVAMSPPARPDTAAVDLLAGDRILLCSDGLHGVIDESSLAKILDSHRVPADACAALINAANDAGGPDNVTAVVIHIEESHGA
ncbi:PP2C family protein-serine/threonine phosphatase [Mycobacterium decipiens]|nr:protein phosphatase 2C domain-containing protein [Mycobacterium decipiens]